MTVTHSIGENELRAILDGLEGVTPGPWLRVKTGGTWYVRGHPTWPCAIDLHDGVWDIAAMDEMGDKPKETKANTSHIARLDPDTVRSIVTELLELRRSAGLGTVSVKPLPTDPNNDPMRTEATFLLARLDDLERGWEDDEAYRQFSGHVVPSAARLRSILAGKSIADQWRENVESMLASGDPDVIRCHEGGGPEDLIGSLVLTMMRTRKARDKALSCLTSIGVEAGTAAPDLLEALRAAKDVIRIWHGPNAWDIYERSSPEMKSINAAISKAGGISS